MYPGSPFEMKCWHPEQKLGDCLVSIRVYFVLLFCSYFLASDSFAPHPGVLVAYAIFLIHL